MNHSWLSPYAKVYGLSDSDKYVHAGRHRVVNVLVICQRLQHIWKGIVEEG